MSCPFLNLFQSLSAIFLNSKDAQSKYDTARAYKCHLDSVQRDRQLEQYLEAMNVMIDWVILTSVREPHQYTVFKYQKNLWLFQTTAGAEAFGGSQCTADGALGNLAVLDGLQKTSHTYINIVIQYTAKHELVSNMTMESDERRQKANIQWGSKDHNDDHHCPAFESEREREREKERRLF